MTTASVPHINVSTFIEVIKRSELIEPKRLEHALKSVVLTSGSDRTASDISEQLIIAGLITKWQAAQLLKGKYRGFMLGKYVIRRPLGRGGMSVVYEAEHSVLNTRVAIKILPQARSDVEKSVSRFLAEARAAAKLNHPNIVRVHDCDVIDNRRFMVMDLVNGSNLGEIVEKQGPLTYRNAILMLRQAASGLAYAHEHGITHRDVKPHNFLVEKGGHLKVADMGLALFAMDVPDRHTQDGTSSVVGTVDYIAPEQAWDSRKVDRRVDMYSLGCTLYFMLTGKPPFHSGTIAQRLAKHQTAAPTPLVQIRPDCPPPIGELCLKMLAKKPQDRVQQMEEVVRFCDQILPRLAGGSNVTVLTPDSERSGSDSHYSMSGDGFLSLQGMDFSTESPSMDSSSFGGLPDFGSLDGSVGMGALAAVPTNSTPFWAQAAAAAPAKPRAKKKSNSPADNGIYVKSAVFLGLFLALAGLGLSIFRAFSTNNEPDRVKPTIKQYETSDGGEVIIVRD
ncbi:MAG: serine/threonine-protein kinase [Pirellulaceae bacterium]